MTEDAERPPHRVRAWFGTRFRTPAAIYGLIVAIMILGYLT